MSRYERDDSLSRAAAIIRARISALPEFGLGRSLVVTGAVDECKGKDVEQMHALGGFSAVLERRIDALPSEFRINHGSRLMPRTVVDTLRDFIPDMRVELQAALLALDVRSKVNGCAS